MLFKWSMHLIKSGKKSKFPHAIEWCRALSQSKQTDFNRLPIERVRSQEDWFKVIQDLSGSQQPTTLEISKIASKLMRYLGESGNYLASKTLMSLLKAKYNGSYRSPILLASYMRICANELNQPAISNSECKNEIEDCLKYVSLSFPFDLNTASDLIAGISHLENWKQTSEIVVNSLKAGSQAYDNIQLSRLKMPLIASSVRDGKYADFKELINELCSAASRSQYESECNSFVSQVVLSACSALKQYQPLKDSQSMLHELICQLESLSSNESSSGFLLLKKESASALSAVIQDLRPWNATFSSHSNSYISFKSGKCRCCNKELPQLTVSASIFNRIREGFIKYAFSTKSEGTRKVDDATAKYIRSNPEELKFFHMFLKKHAPFDVVIDGLNVAHRHGQPRSTFKSSSQRGAVVLKLANYYSTALRKRVLVVAKKHVEKTWSPAIVEELRRMNPTVKLFLSDNLSDDDSLLISAALISGTKSRIISHDDFRQPAAIFPPRSETYSLRPSFRRWLASCHMIFVRWDDKLNRPILREPRSFVVGVSKTKQSLANRDEFSVHIPYEGDSLMANENASESIKSRDGRFSAIPVFCLSGKC